MGKIPPDKCHPLYGAWLAASVRCLEAMRRLDGLTEGDPEFEAARIEHDEAHAAHH